MYTGKVYRDLVGVSNLKDLDKVVELIRNMSSGLTIKLRERFCKDMNIPIKLYREPYFSERLATYNQHKFVLNLLASYVDLVERCGGEQEYFALYNTTKDKAINYLNDNEAMNYFVNSEDMNKFKSLTGYPKSDIYKQTFAGKTFVSVDLVKANYTALKHYNPEIVGNTSDYAEFMGMFTDEPYLKASKYIRQVIFGNVNTKRQTTYAKYLTSKVLEYLLDKGIDTVVYFSTDEVVFDADDFTEEAFKVIESALSAFYQEGVVTKLEYFKLHYIPEAKTYVKESLLGSDKGSLDFKCMTADMMSVVVKFFYGNEVTENDYVFELEGRSAMWLDKIEIDPSRRLRTLASWERI